MRFALPIEVNSFFFNVLKCDHYRARRRGITDARLEMFDAVGQHQTDVNVLSIISDDCAHNRSRSPDSARVERRQARGKAMNTLAA